MAKGRESHSLSQDHRVLVLTCILIKAVQGTDPAPQPPAPSQASFISIADSQPEALGGQI